MQYIRLHAKYWLLLFPPYQFVLLSRIKLIIRMSALIIKLSLDLDKIKLQMDPLFSFDIQIFQIKSMAVVLFVIMLQIACVPTWRIIVLSAVSRRNFFYIIRKSAYMDARAKDFFWVVLLSLLVFNCNKSSTLYNAPCSLLINKHEYVEKSILEE